LHFKRAKAPEWVLEELQNLKTSAIGFEIEEDETTRDSVPVEDDGNPVHGEIYERASDNDDLILHESKCKCKCKCKDAKLAQF
jgi:hypothetical protein